MNKENVCEIAVQPLGQPMAFYHSDGLVPAYKQAAKFAGKSGHLATLPEIMAARASSVVEVDGSPWLTCHASLSAEYFGRSKSGKLILIVAHGIGPMSNLDGILKAYSWQYNDKTRDRCGGRITQQEFWDLEDGKYGPVAIVDMESYCKMYRYPFRHAPRVSQLDSDLVFQARLGTATTKYIQAHEAFAQEWHSEMRNDAGELDFIKAMHVVDVHDPLIVEIEDNSNCSYCFGMQPRDLEEGYALAHLLSVSPLIGCMGVEDNDGLSHHSMIVRVKCYQWNDIARFVAIPEGSEPEMGIHPGPNPYHLLRNHWQELLEPADGPLEIGMRKLMNIGDQYFITDPRIGDECGARNMENPVVSMEKIGEPIPLRIEISGWYGYFRWSESDITAIAPREANAFVFASEPKIEDHPGKDPEFHICTVQFYKVQIDPTKKLLHVSTLEKDYDKMMSLLLKER